MARDMIRFTCSMERHMQKVRVRMSNSETGEVIEGNLRVILQHLTREADWMFRFEDQTTWKIETVEEVKR